MMSSKKDEVYKKLADEATMLLEQMREIVNVKMGKHEAYPSASGRYIRLFNGLADKYKKITRIMDVLRHDYTTDMNDFKEDVYLVHYQYYIAPERTTEALKLDIEEAEWKKDEPEYMMEYWTEKKAIAEKELSKRLESVTNS